MRYLEAPNYLHDHLYKRSVFLAGSITGAVNWQRNMANWVLECTDLQVFNPRRKNFNVEDDLDREQIAWEDYHLNVANLIIFWFSSETVAPITLFELGKHINKDIIVGSHLDYPRRNDLEIQLNIARPDLKIVYSPCDVQTEIFNWNERQKWG